MMRSFKSYGLNGEEIIAGGLGTLIFDAGGLFYELADRLSALLGASPPVKTPGLLHFGLLLSFVSVFG